MYIKLIYANILYYFRKQAKLDTHYKTVTLAKKNYTDLGKDEYGMKNLINSMDNVLNYFACSPLKIKLEWRRGSC